MILYTPLCEMDIFPLEENEWKNRSCMTYEGKLVYVEKLEDGSYELLQLLSTDPEDYLNPQFTPGNHIQIP